MRIPLFDKQSADFCFEKSCAILSKPFTLALTPDEPTASISHKTNKRTTTSDSRDFIGDNLLDIENTLKALNLDFLNAFNELEKTDSAETLFGEHSYPYEATNNPKLRNSALKLSKLTHNYNLGGKSDFGSPKSIKSMQFSPLGEGVGASVKKTFMGSSQFFSGDPPDDKRSSTPDTGFASRETTSSRRGSQKSSYSPQESTCRFSPREFNYPVSGAVAAYISEHSAATRKLSSSPSRTAHSSINSINSIHPPSTRRFDYHPNSIDQSFATRKRSMSFTENYDLKSPVLSEPQPPPPLPKHDPVSSAPFDVAAAVRRMHIRASSVYKPRSIKARNLRRLSYNPIVLDSSSSSNSDSDFDKSIAHSECDIRSTGRRRRQFMNRKSNTVDHHQPPDKLYGSNASIKSAPQYNYASDRQLHKYLDQKFNLRGGDEHSGALYDFFNGRIASVESGGGTPLANQQTLGVEGPSAFSRHSALFSEFDVSKLTGKSPTTHCFLNELFPSDKAPGGVPPTPPPSATSVHNGRSAKSAPAKGGAFQWPEKIHASAVKQNDMLWRNQNTAKLVAGQSYSSDSSSTETGGGGGGAGNVGGSNRVRTAGSSSLGFRSEFGIVDRATMPPSPAP